MGLKRYIMGFVQVENEWTHIFISLSCDDQKEDRA